jgi:hypothetical protein
VSDNPYEAPRAPVADAPPAVVDPEAERVAHLRRESGLRAIGLLCLLFGAYFLLMGGVMAWTTYEHPERMGGIGLGLVGVFGALGLVAVPTGWGYLRLRPWVRVPAGIVALVTLLASTFLTAPIVAYAAYLTYSAKGLRVLSRDYAAVRAATPGLSAWRWPREAFIVLGMLGLYFAAFAWVVVGLRED